jgi:hypothetical protein
MLVGKYPKPSKNGKERRRMNGRKRTVQIKFRVTEEERTLIEEKMKLILEYYNKSAVLKRKEM